MKEIKLTQGKVALVDDEDYEELNQYKWYAQKGGNAFYAARTALPSRSQIRMHRVIKKSPDDKEIDHRNHNGLDNRKENLRICTRSQNQYNQKLSKNSTSGHKGVSWKQQNKKWQAHITINGIRKYLGYYTAKEKARLAYNKAAKELFGEFALLNSIGG